VLPCVSVYLPTSHRKHEIPKGLAYLPAVHHPQLSSVLPSVARYLPSEHVKHVSAVEARKELEYFPLPHKIQSALPPVEYFPAGQSRQVVLDDCPSSVENVPAEHGWQYVLPSVSVYLPTPHRVHELIPMVLEYLPAGPRARWT
jgi:hypothetical protein